MLRDLYYGVSDQAKASKHRMADAKALLNAVHCRGAMYLAGYAVECLLKTKLMRIYGCRHLRELDEELKAKGFLGEHATIFTHHLESLLRLTNGLDRLRQNQTLWKEFNNVNRWVPAWRYSPDISNPDDAGDFLDSVSKILHWIEHNV